MENKRVFIGNLNFEVTESELKTLLSKYGTVLTIKLNQKKGYAFIEMSDAAEAVKVINKLDGVKFKDREIRASLEMKASKAKSLSVKKYKERGKNISMDNSVRADDSMSRSKKYRDSITKRSKDDEKIRYSDEISHPKSKGNFRSTKRSSGFAERSSGEFKKERSGFNAPERDRWSTERPVESSGKRRDFRTAEKPSYSSRSSRDGEKPSYSDRQSRNGERSGSTKTLKKEWSYDRSSGSTKKTSDSWRERSPKKDQSEYKVRDYSKSRSVSGSQNRFSKTSRTKSGDAARKGSPAGSRTKPGRSGNKDRENRSKRD